MDSECTLLIHLSRKTQLVLEYAYSRCSDPTCSVFWVHADSETSFTHDYKRIADKLGLADSLEGERLWTAVRNQIETLSHWVLVLDNADDLALFGAGRGSSVTKLGPDLSDYIPRGTVGTILWTSRDQRIVGSLVGLRRGIHVAKMTDSEGESLLDTIKNLETRKEIAEDVSRLLIELGSLPLAISQAATYMRRTRLSTAEYLDQIQERKKRWRLLRKSEHDRYRRPQASNSVLETWDISIEYIRQESEMAYGILNVLAFVDSQNITFQMFVEAARLLSSLPDGEASGYDSSRNNIDISGSGSDSDGAETEEEIVYLIARLEEFSFLTARISEGSQRRSYDIHQLVQQALSYNLSIRKDKGSQKVRSAKVAFQIIDHLFPTEFKQETWDKCESYLIHAQRVGEWAGVHNGELGVSRLLTRAFDYLHERGRYREMEPVCLAALNLQEKALGKTHADTIGGMTNLAITYRKQAQYKKAEEIMAEVLQIRHEILGKRHPTTIWSMEELAIIYHNQGRCEKAEEILTDVLQLRREVFGPKHPATIWSMAEFAILYRKQGRNKEAEAILVDILPLRSEILGQKHPETLWNMAELASVYKNQGRYKEAEEIQHEVLRLQKQILRQEHPDTLWSMAELASIYRQQKRINEEEEILAAVSKLRQRVLGQKHPDTLVSMAKLASVYRKQERVKEAGEILAEILQFQQQVLGKEHANTLWTMAELALIYQKQGEIKKAEETLAEVLELRQQVLGQKHPNTLWTMRALGRTYRKQNMTEEKMDIDRAIRELLVSDSRK